MDSLEKIHRSVEEMEVKLLHVAFSYLEDKSENVMSFETILEWFFTWRIKLEDLENAFWCDGVFDLTVAHGGKNCLEFEGMAYVGPESNIEEIYKSKFTGSITLNKKRKSIENYDFSLHVNNRIFCIKSQT